MSALPEKRYTDPAGWSLSYPPGMHLERSSYDGSVQVTEVTVASFAMRTAMSSTGDLDPPLDADGRFPLEGIAFRLMFKDGPPQQTGPFGEPELTLPISLDTWSPRDSADGSVPASIGRSISANGDRYHVIAWIAPDAREELRAQLEQVLNSLTFPPLLPGTELRSGFVVLDDEARYPPGSFTRINAKGVPLYVVRAPGGFYALGWHWSGPERGYRAGCELHVDEPLREIYCSRCPARWNRVGRVITRPPTADEDDSLHLSIAKLSWDGHLMVHPGTHQIAFANTSRHFWPEWLAAD